MKLEVLVGDQEYLWPRQLANDELDRLVQSVAPGAVVLRAEWAHANGEGRPPKEDPYGTGFLYEDPAATEERVALYLEYLQDMSAPGQTCCVVLPFESALTSGRLHDARVRDFVACAR